jgi:predicted NBD/HSP70 family sugar kinase
MDSMLRPKDSPRQNERRLITCLRRMGPASKPDLARSVALTPQAVHGIVDSLVEAGLVEAGGRREGQVGHPSRLYAIKPGGAFAIGVEVGPRHIETALVNFIGQMVYRSRAVYPKLDARNVIAETLTSIEATLAHARSAGIEMARIAGAGIVTSAGASSAEALSTALAPALQRHTRLSLPVHVERQVVAEALFLTTFSPTSLPQNCLFIALGRGVDGCLMLDGAVRAAHQCFASLPISETETLGDVAGLERLEARLGTNDCLDLSTEAFFRATQANPAVFEAWLDDVAKALAMAIGAVHALHMIARVFVDIATPASVGNLLIERTADKLRTSARGNGENRLPEINRIAPPGSPALPAGTVALHALYAPGIGVGQRALLND